MRHTHCRHDCKLWNVQVCVIKLPVEMVQNQLAEILEGILLWSQDSKNKFRLKVGLLFFGKRKKE